MPIFLNCEEQGPGTNSANSDTPENADDVAGIIPVSRRLSDPDATHGLFWQCGHAGKPSRVCLRYTCRVGKEFVASLAFSELRLGRRACTCEGSGVVRIGFAGTPSSDAGKADGDEQLFLLRDY